MKKVICLAVLLLGASLFFSSCGLIDGDSLNTSNYSKLLIGTWEEVKEEKVLSDGSIEPLSTGEGDVISFYRNGMCNIAGVSYTYELNGRIIIVLLEYWRIERITEEELILNVPILNTPSSYLRQYFKKKG